MGQIHAYSSVSVFDQSDVGALSSFLTSNQPTSVVLDPNTGIYNPDWSHSPYLVITPVISYSGIQLPLDAQGLTVTFKRKDGSGNVRDLVSNETVEGNILTVSANKLSTSINGIITYICNIAYVDPHNNITVRTQNTISYSLMSSAANVRHAYIIGEGSFLYDSNRNRVGIDHITLNADVQGVSVLKWQYLNSSGVFVDFPTTHNPSISTTTLDVYDSELNIWVNNRTATIKLATTDESIFDIHQIQKIYDGAPGSATVSVVLSNQSLYVPCDSEGNVLLTPPWDSAATQVFVYEGGENVTASWDITANVGGGLQGTFVNNVFTPTALSNETSYVDFVCTKNGYGNLTARYTITKSRSGEDGKPAVIYEVEPSSYILNLNEQDAFVPTQIVFRAYSKTASANRIPYNGRFIIAESFDGSTYTDVQELTSQTDEPTKTYTPNRSDIWAIRCRLYASGGTTTLLDEQNVVVTRDGISGENGINGFSMYISNTQDVIPCNQYGYVIESHDFRIPYYGYYGIERVPVTAVISSKLPSGMSLVSNTPGTAERDGELILNVEQGAYLDDPTLLSGTIEITLICGLSLMDFLFTDENDNLLVDEDDSIFMGEASLKCQYVWTKNIRGENGFVLQIYSDDGGVIRNSEGSVTLKTRFLSGSMEIIPPDIQWYKFSAGSYQALENETNTSLLVTASMVDDLALFKVVVTYLGETYEAFYTVDDLQDQITAVVLSSVQDFKNNDGCAAIYTRLYRGNEEIDLLKTTTFSTFEPTLHEIGDYYYHIDQIAKTVTLKQFTSSGWVDALDTNKYIYKYYRLDKDGTPLDVDRPYNYRDGSYFPRCIYVDPSVIHNQDNGGDVMQFICEVDE